jgi:hypothetical protein
MFRSSMDLDFAIGRSRCANAKSAFVQAEASHADMNPVDRHKKARDPKIAGFPEDEP